MLDPDAVKAAEAGGGKLEDRVRLADLADAGWTVAAVGARGPTARRRSRCRSRSRRRTRWPGSSRELSGPNGPLQRRRRRRRDHGAALHELLGDRRRSTSPRSRPASPPTPTLVGRRSRTQQVDVNAIDQSLLAAAPRRRVGGEGGGELPGGSQHHGQRREPGSGVPIDASTSVLDTRRIVLLVRRGGAGRARDRRAARSAVAVAAVPRAPACAASSVHARVDGETDALAGGVGGDELSHPSPYRPGGEDATPARERSTAAPSAAASRRAGWGAARRARRGARWSRMRRAPARRRARRLGGA